MRIGVITTSYPRSPEDPAGGFVRGLNLYLQRQGHQVEVIAAGEVGAAGAPAAARASVDGDGIAVLRLPCALFYRGGAPDALSRGGAAALLAAAGFQARLLAAGAARVRRYDALISHWLLPSGLAAALCAAGRPHVAIAHSSDVHLLRRLHLGGVGRWLSRRARLVYTSASLQLPGAPGVVVPMGVTVSEFSATAAQRATARRELGLLRPTALALGRLVPVKGLGGLLAALAPLPDVELLIAGDGPLRPALEQQAAGLGLGSRVRFLGEVRGLARRRLLHGCDALVLPSRVLADGRTESAPVVLLEALAAGLPIVAAAVGGVAELLGDAGLLVPPDAPAALTFALRQVLLTPGVAATYSARARERAAQFDWAVIAPRLLGQPLGCPAEQPPAAPNLEESTHAAAHSGAGQGQGPAAPRAAKLRPA